MNRITLLLISALFAPRATVFGQTVDPPRAEGDTTTRVATAARATAPPLINGVLDDTAWSAAAVVSDFVQRVPFDGTAASERTEVRVLADEAAIYVGVWMLDRAPERIVDGESIRDASLDQSDAVLLIFDTFRDRRNGFVFGTNPAGIEYDGQVVNEGEGSAGGGGRQQLGAGSGFNLNWDGSWDVATSRDERGWYAEFRIPFSTLRYGSGEAKAWGFNVARRIRRHNEESMWSAVPRQFSLYRLSSAGLLEGLTPPTRRHTTVTPYVLASAHRDWTAGDGEYLRSSEVGADAKVQITQGLTLDLTYNTDFAQVEVDEAQVNLTRFSLRFPEKRPFFLENSGLFTLGGGQSELFFSRRIGIVEGQLVPIQGGGRLSGRVGGLNLGLLHIRSDDAGTLARGEAFSVARVARELPNRSRLGAIYVHKDVPGGGGDNRTYGVDGQLGIGENLTFSSYGGWTETPGLEGKNHVFSATGSHTSRSLRLNANYREVGAAFNPEVGFAPRVNYRYYQGMWMIYIRPQRTVRELRPHMSFETYRNLRSGFEQSARLHVDSHVELPSGAFFSPAFDYVTEGLEQPFEISEGIVVPAGTYSGWEAAWRINSDRSAPLSFDGGIDWGSFLSGTRRGGFGAVSFRAGSTFSTSVRVSYNDVRLAEGDFTARLLTWRAGYLFTPRVYVQSLVQYSDQANTWAANLRFGWLNTAGTGLFIVFNEARGVASLERDTPLNRGIILKFNRQFSPWDGW